MSNPRPGSDSVEDAPPAGPGKELLSFRTVGRQIRVSAVAEEFGLMRDSLGGDLTPEVATRICEKSGTHLLKLVSPRIDGQHAVLRAGRPGQNRRPAPLSSVNAPDIPFCKVIFRPLELEGTDPMSVVDHVLNPAHHSDQVLDAFATVFGADTLQAIRDVLLGPAPVPTKLAAENFPIFFVPRPGGGDLQITPVAPAQTFMGIKRVKDLYFEKATPDRPRPPRGRWHAQAVSSKPQNISGAIGGARVRFLATMPATMRQEAAELYRYVHGGGFPRWRDEEVRVWVLRYGDMLNAGQTFNNQDTRAALDRTADRLIRDALTFRNEMLEDAKSLSVQLDRPAALPNPPGPATILIRRARGSDEDHGRARKALTSPHFEHRVSKASISDPEEKAYA
jgi:hypothetical protein